MENSKMEQLRIDLEKAQEGLEKAEQDIDKFSRQLADGQRINQEYIDGLLDKNPDWSVGQAFDGIYQSKPQKMDHLRESHTKAMSARNYYRRQLAAINSEIKQIEAGHREEDAQESGEAIFSQVDEFVKCYNAAQIAFEELKEKVLMHPVTDDLIARAGKCERHVTYGVTAQSHLSPGLLSSLSLDGYAAQLHELTKGGFGQYEDTPAELKIFYDGNVSGDFSINTAFDKRQGGIGFREESPTMKGDRAARGRLAQLLR